MKIDLFQSCGHCWVFQIWWHIGCSTFTASGSFPMSGIFSSGSQGIGTSTSASVLPMNIQGWFSLGLTCLISLSSRELSRVFSNTTVQKHQLFGIQPHHFMAYRWGNSRNSGWLYFLGLPNHCRWLFQPWNWKTLTPWKECYGQHRQHIKKQRHWTDKKAVVHIHNRVSLSH